MDVDLTSELQQFVAGKVASGAYATSSEVLIAGIQLLSEREVVEGNRLEALRRDLALGIEQADNGDLIDGEPFMAHLLSRHQNRVSTAA